MRIDQLFALAAAIMVASFGGSVRGQGYDSYAQNESVPCCTVDMLLLIDRSSFNGSEANLTNELNQLFSPAQLSCMDLRLVAIEYGDNASLVYSFANSTSQGAALAFLQNYTLGPDLGPGSNIQSAFALLAESVS